MEVVGLVFLFILGACLGSFLCCMARRSRLKNKKIGNRSICLKCKTRLKWYDNIPIISWILLKGKCRQCGCKIGKAEIISEIGVGLSFLLVGLSFFFDGASFRIISFESPQFLALFITLLFFVLGLDYLAIYDGIYGELPVLILTISIICATIIAVLKQWILFSSFSISWQSISDLAISVIILGGLYLFLYLVSKGKWVGDGDWLLGVAIGIALGKPLLALYALFASNLLACIIMLPAVKGKHKKIPLGPFLVTAFIIVFAFQNMLQ